MSDHLTPERLETILRGAEDSEEALRGLTRHLLDLCPDCRRGFEAWREQVHAPAHARDGRRARPAVVDSSGFVSRGLEWIERAARRMAALDEEADRLWAELAPLSQAQRWDRVRGAEPGRFANPRLVARLLQESRTRVVTTDPSAALAVAELAEELASRLAPSDYGRTVPLELVVEAKALRANAVRVTGDVRTADDVFAAVERLIRTEGLDDLGLRARIWSLLASLRKDQRRLEEARSLLRRAISASRTIRDEELQVKASLKLADVLFLDGRADEAALALRRVLPRVVDLNQPVLWQCALGNLVHYEVAAGRVVEGRALFDWCRPLLLDGSNPGNRKRVRWLEGRLLHAEGRYEEAEAAYGDVRDAAVDAEHGYDAALVTLDLAALYHERGR